MYRRPLTIAEAADLPLSMCALTITAEIGTNKESFQMQYITAKTMRRGARTRVNLLDGDKTRLQVQRFRVGAPQPAPRAPVLVQDKREPDNLSSRGGMVYFQPFLFSADFFACRRLTCACCNSITTKIWKATKGSPWAWRG